MEVDCFREKTFRWIRVFRSRRIPCWQTPAIVSLRASHPATRLDSFAMTLACTFKRDGCDLRPGSTLLELLLALSLTAVLLGAVFAAVVSQWDLEDHWARPAGLIVMQPELIKIDFLHRPMVP